MLEMSVPPAALDLAELWLVPAGASPVALRTATDGSDPRLATTICAYRDETNLYCLFNAVDDEVVATLYQRDAPLYEEDAVEVFLSPAELEKYYEFEVSPMGTLFDAVVHSPDRRRASMQVDRAWDCNGFWAAVRTEKWDGGMLAVQTLVAIPFAGLGVAAPVAGDVWRANFFRIDRSSRGDGFSAWSPTLCTPPDFHLPDRFGTLRFA